MKLLSVDQIKSVSGGDDPGMGPYVPGVTQGQSNAIADATFGLAAPVLGAAAIYTAGAAFSSYFGVSLPSVTGIAGAELGNAQGSTTGGLRGLWQDYTWGQFQILNDQNGFTPDGTTYTFPSGTTPIIVNDASDYVPAPTITAQDPAPVDNVVNWDVNQNEWWYDSGNPFNM